MNLLGILQYDGTDFFGWQIQKDFPTIQGEVMRSLKRIYSEDIAIKYTSRTDRGVHASGQIITFTPTFTIPSGKLIQILNSTLNKDISFRKIKRVSNDFDPRYSVDSKLYIYRYYLSDPPSYMMKRFVWEQTSELDLSRMRKGVSLLKGEREFKLLSSDNIGKRTKINIISASIVKNNEIIELRIRAPYFRTYMMRHIAGNLAAIGRGQFSLKEFENMLEGKGLHSAYLAPARGLELRRVYF